MEQEGSDRLGEEAARSEVGAWKMLERRADVELNGVFQMLADLDEHILFTQKQIRSLEALRDSWSSLLKEHMGDDVAAATEAESERRCNAASTDQGNSQLVVPLALSCLPNTGRSSPATSSSGSPAESSSAESSYEGGSQTAPAQFAPSSLRAPASKPTTLTVRNIPARCTQEELFEELALGGLVDFLYLPRPSKKKKGTGSAYVNFVSHGAALGFVRQWHGRCLASGRSKATPLDIVYSELQGYRANVERSLDVLEAVAADDDSMLPLIMEGGVRVDARKAMEAMRDAATDEQTQNSRVEERHAADISQ